MRVGLGMVALAACAMAAASPAAADDEDQYSRVLGPWKVSGSNGVCSAALVKMPGSTVFIFVSPDEGNDGGIMMTTPRKLAADSDNWTTVTVTMAAGKPEARPAEVYDDPTGIYIPIKTGTELAAMPDDWHLKISGQGMTLLDVDLHGVKAAVAALNECDRVTDKNGMT